jgi:hypothetical protein
MRALLILACSQRKRTETGAAWDVYDGRTFQVLKKLFRECGRPAGLDILIVSAKHGVIRATRRIDPYDAKLTAGGEPGRWATNLRRLTAGREYAAVFVNLGRHYLRAVGDVRALFPAATFAAGGIGERNAQTRAWVASQGANRTASPSSSRRRSRAGTSARTRRPRLRGETR